VGSYVDVLQTTTDPGGVVPAEPSQVTAINPSTGFLTLTRPLARTFTGTPLINNITSLATLNNGMENITVDGSWVVNASEEFGFSIVNCTLNPDLFTATNPDEALGWGGNTIQNVLITGNTILPLGTPAGIANIGFELAQRNSDVVIFSNNTVTGNSGGFGEYNAHWTLSNNTFNMSSNSGSPGLVTGGVDVTVSNNIIADSSSTASAYSDFAGPDSYAPFVNTVKVLSNTITCGGVLPVACVELRASDTVFNNNSLPGSGGLGLLVQGPNQQFIMVQGNTFNNFSRPITFNTPCCDGSTITDNILKGTGFGITGINITNPASPYTGSNFICRNDIVGFTNSIVSSQTLHPGTIICNRNNYINRRPK
jgi:hypothetical protein